MKSFESLRAVDNFPGHLC